MASVPVFFFVIQYVILIDFVPRKTLLPGALLTTITSQKTPNNSNIDDTRTVSALYRVHILIVHAQ